MLLLKQKKDRIYNWFLARKLNENENDLTFTFDCVTNSLEKPTKETEKTLLDFSQDNKNGNESEKVKTVYKQQDKTKNFLSNISYNGVKEEDFSDRNFVFDAFVLFTKNLNPFSLECKVTELKNREIIYMFWEDVFRKPSFDIFAREITSRI